MTRTTLQLYYDKTIVVNEFSNSALINNNRFFI